MSHSGDTQWWAHRGTLQHENTLRGIRDALDAGVDGVEVDLQISSDGEVFLFHDKSLRRLAGHEIRAGALTWAQLQDITLQCGEKIPHLEALLEMWPADRTLNLELKDGGVPLVRAVTPLVASFDLQDVVLSSFDGTILNAATVMPWPRAMLVETVSPAWIHASGAKSLNCPWTFVEACLVTPELIARHAADGIEVGVWGATSPEEEARLEQMGIRRIISDFRVQE